MRPDKTTETSRLDGICSRVYGEEILRMDQRSAYFIASSEIKTDTIHKAPYKLAGEEANEKSLGYPYAGEGTAWNVEYLGYCLLHLLFV